jgi:hypothetical protein
MYDIINDQECVVGKISWVFCYSVEDLHRAGLCGKDIVPHLIKQIQEFDYPVVVLDNIEIHERSTRLGYGTDAMRHFHEIVALKGARFALLRIGLFYEHETYSEGAKWRRKFYGKQGWIELVKPNISHLFWEWMYKPLITGLNTPVTKGVRFAVSPPKRSFLYLPFDAINDSICAPEWSNLSADGIENRFLPNSERA